MKSSGTVSSPRVVCIVDLRRVAQKRVPKAVFDYLDGGTEDEITPRENCRIFVDITFSPRCAVAFPDCACWAVVLY